MRIHAPRWIREALEAEEAETAFIDLIEVCVSEGGLAVSAIQSSSQVIQGIAAPYVGATPLMQPPREAIPLAGHLLEFRAVGPSLEAGAIYLGFVLVTALLLFVAAVLFRSFSPTLGGAWIVALCMFLLLATGTGLQGELGADPTQLGGADMLQRHVFTGVIACGALLWALVFAVRPDPDAERTGRWWLAALRAVRLAVPPVLLLLCAWIELDAFWAGRNLGSTQALGPLDVAGLRAEVAHRRWMVWRELLWAGAIACSVGAVASARLGGWFAGFASWLASGGRLLLRRVVQWTSGLPVWGRRTGLGLLAAIAGGGVVGTLFAFQDWSNLPVTREHGIAVSCAAAVVAAATAPLLWTVGPSWSRWSVRQLQRVFGGGVDPNEGLVHLIRRNRVLLAGFGLLGLGLVPGISNGRFFFGMDLKPAEFAPIFLAMGLAGMFRRFSTSPFYAPRQDPESVAAPSLREWMVKHWRPGVFLAFLVGFGFFAGTTSFVVMVLLATATVGLFFTQKVLIAAADRRLRARHESFLNAYAERSGAPAEYNARVAAAREARDAASSELVVRMQLIEEPRYQFRRLLAAFGSATLLVCTVYAMSGDFGPLLVLIPSMFAMAIAWSLTDIAPAGAAVAGPSSAAPQRSMSRVAAVLLVAAVCVGLVSIGVWLTGLDGIADLPILGGALARAGDRLETFRRSWYTESGSWSVQALWLAGTYYARGAGPWLANLHSDLAYIGVTQRFGLLSSMATLGLFALVAVWLGYLGGRRLNQAARRMASASFAGPIGFDPDADKAAEAGFFLLFCGAYVAFEVVIHTGTCFLTLPQTGLTLPWVSSGGSASIAFALLLGLSLRAFLASSAIERDPDPGEPT